MKKLSIALAITFISSTLLGCTAGQQQYQYDKCEQGVVDTTYVNLKPSSSSSSSKGGSFSSKPSKSPKLSKSNNNPVKIDSEECSD